MTCEFIKQVINGCGSVHSWNTSHNIVETKRKRGAKTKPPTTPLKMPTGEGGGGGGGKLKKKNILKINFSVFPL